MRCPGSWRVAALRAVSSSAFSFAAEDPLLRTLAVDVAIAVLADRRCDGDALGAALVRVLHDRRLSTAGRARYRYEPKGDIKVTRWAEPLERIADAGPLQAHDVQTMLERVLAAAGDNDRRALAGSVDLLRRLAMDAEAAVTDDAARSWLARYSPTAREPCGDRRPSPRRRARREPPHAFLPSLV